MIRKWTVYTMALLWNSPFTFVQEKYFSFRYQSGFLRQIDPPSTRRKIDLVCHPVRKYFDSMDYVPISNTTLFLRTLILKFLYATVTSYLPQFAYPFKKNSTNIVWSSKQIEFLARRLGGPESSIQIYFFVEGSIRCVLL